MWHNLTCLIIFLGWGMGVGFSSLSFDFAYWTLLTTNFMNSPPLLTLAALHLGRYV